MLFQQQQNLTRFQQNPTHEGQPGALETGADMFLNWVYRRTTDLAPAGDPCNYPLTGEWEGFQNITVNEEPDLQLSGNVRYWWMDQEMQQILP
jgi:hypothetical protein